MITVISRDLGIWEEPIDGLQSVRKSIPQHNEECWWTDKHKFIPRKLVIHLKYSFADISCDWKMGSTINDPFVKQFYPTIGYTETL